MHTQKMQQKTKSTEETPPRSFRSLDLQDARQGSPSPAVQEGLQCPLTEFRSSHRLMCPAWFSPHATIASEKWIDGSSAIMRASSGAQPSWTSLTPGR